MIELEKTDATNLSFIKLVKKLDDELAIRDGNEHDFYDQFNKIDTIKYVIVARKDGRPIGCGAIKEFDEATMEVKRMYVDDVDRGNGYATLILKALEDWAKVLGFEKCILETGIRQPEAIALYKKNGFELIDNYGQYRDVENSLCFEKTLVGKLPV